MGMVSLGIRANTLQKAGGYILHGRKEMMMMMFYIGILSAPSAPPLPAQKLNRNSENA